jgi:farnesyl diphosphate synthase
LYTADAIATWLGTVDADFASLAPRFIEEGFKSNHAIARMSPANFQSLGFSQGAAVELSGIVADNQMGAYEGPQEAWVAPNGAEPVMATRDEFLACFEELSVELVEKVVNDPARDPTMITVTTCTLQVRSLINPEHHALEVKELTTWCQRLLEYAGPGGKLNRGLTVCHVFERLCPGAPQEKRKQAMVLGWAVELLQAFFLVADDVMDASTTRRGKLCWYKLPDVGVKAVNDSFILESFVYILMKEHLGGEACYGEVVDIMHECAFQTELGQALDLNTETACGGGGEELHLEEYTMARVQAIAKHKTSYYSFYLPAALGMALAGISPSKNKSAFAAAKDICVDIGVYFQAQDDFLDCYGDPEVIGKIGTDIESAKCSWLMATALSVCSPEQRQLIQDNYGQDDAGKVAIIKQVFEDLKLRQAYEAYEAKSYAELSAMVDEIKVPGLPNHIFHDLIAKVYKRSK